MEFFLILRIGAKWQIDNKLTGQYVYSMTYAAVLEVTPEKKRYTRLNTRRAHIVIASFAALLACGAATAWVSSWACSR